jgi:outer membrane lipoprotein SlyB
MILRLQGRTLIAALLLGLAACSPPQDESAKNDQEPPAAEQPQKPAEAPKPQPEPQPAKPQPAPEHHAERQAKPAAREVENAPPVCADCGTIASISQQKAPGQGSGAGAVLGAVTGGLVGHQVGGGTGKKIATVAGAVGGAYAGHQVEKRVRSTTYYTVGVNMEDGSYRSVEVADVSNLSVGSKVRVVGNSLQLR